MTEIPCKGILPSTKEVKTMADPVQQCSEGSNVLAADAPKLSSAATEVSLATGAAGEGSTVAIVSNNPQM
jgi:hypothetical protein